MRTKLLDRGSDIIIGGNIGKNKTTPNENAVDDYLKCILALHDVVDYFVVNISSPNTPGLRDLQDGDYLTELLDKIVASNNSFPIARPIFVKIAPDLTDEQIKSTVDVINKSGIQGIIATNTTISREGFIATEKELKVIGNGGLSGKPLSERSTHVIKLVRGFARKGLIIIASGGISSSKDALKKIESGADLVQIYTGFIYEGPGLINTINDELRG
jgi:dihydroorotate dehydrogenase